MSNAIPPNQSPTFVAPIATPSLGGGGSASIVFSTSIAATPTRCLEILLDPETYPTWNEWVPKVVVDSPPPPSVPAAPSVSGSPLPPSLAHLAAKEGQLLPQTRFTLEVHMSASFVQKTELELSVLEEFERDGRHGLRVAWKSPGHPWLIRAERVQEFLGDGHGGCDYTSYETFYGPGTWAVKTFFAKQLQHGLTLWMNGLKAEAEKAKSGAAE